ncbi:hypothetical protein [Candidatus Poriferisodalis sp.]|uniref:hypothetical protein n=1 Tax=Candidatus Poriferisodalis sp. TaxID=3101277 RepID=UPI003B018862
MAVALSLGALAPATAQVPSAATSSAAAADTSLGALAPATAQAGTDTDSPSVDAPEVQHGAAVHPVVASYAVDYAVTHAEAKRRLDRIDELQPTVERLHTAVRERLAGWGIDHDGPLTLWVWLSGDEAPSAAAVEIAAAHDDLEIRTGAKVTYAALVAAQKNFGFGSSVGPVAGVGSADGGAVDFADLMTHTDIDLRANALEIGIDRTQLPGAAVPGDLEATVPFGPTGNTGGGITTAQLRDSITELLAPHINVPYRVIAAEFIASEAPFDGVRHSQWE